MLSEDLNYAKKASIDTFLQLSLEKQQGKNKFPLDVKEAASILWQNKRSLQDHLKTIFSVDNDFIKECATENYIEVPYDEPGTTQFMTVQGFGQLISRSKGIVATYFKHQFFALFLPSNNASAEGEPPTLAPEVKLDVTAIKKSLKAFVASDADYPVPIKEVRKWITADSRRAYRILSKPELQSHKNEKKTHLTVNGLLIFCQLAKTNPGRDVYSLLAEIIKDSKSLNSEDTRTTGNPSLDPEPPRKKQKIDNEDDDKELQKQILLAQLREATAKAKLAEYNFQEAKRKQKLSNASPEKKSTEEAEKDFELFLSNGTFKPVAYFCGELNCKHIPDLDEAVETAVYNKKFDAEVQFPAEAFRRLESKADGTVGTGRQYNTLFQDHVLQAIQHVYKQNNTYFTA